MDQLIQHQASKKNPMMTVSPTYQLNLVSLIPSLVMAKAILRMTKL